MFNKLIESVSQFNAPDMAHKPNTSTPWCSLAFQSDSDTGGLGKVNNMIYFNIILEKTAITPEKLMNHHKEKGTYHTRVNAGNTR